MLEDCPIMDKPRPTSQDRMPTHLPASGIGMSSGLREDDLCPTTCQLPASVSGSMKTAQSFSGVTPTLKDVYFGTQATIMHHNMKQDCELLRVMGSFCQHLSPTLCRLHEFKTLLFRLLVCLCGVTNSYSYVAWLS